MEALERIAERLESFERATADRFTMLEQEFDVFIRLERLKAEARGINEQEAALFAEFDRLLDQRRAMLVRPDKDDEDTDPGGRRPRNLTPIR